MDGYSGKFVIAIFCLSSDVESSFLSSTANAAMSKIDNLQYLESWFNLVNN